MARNNAWSNARLLAACARLSPEELEAKRVSFFPSLLATLNHILTVDRNYLADMKGLGRQSPERLSEKRAEPYLRLADLADAQARIDHALIAFCDGLTEPALDRIVAIDRQDGVDYRETIGDILAHLFVHQIHHRGQVHAMLSGTAVAPPQLDEFFLSSDAPQRNAELRTLGINM
jgi:uncharacterized damage-inducible protein DinB